MASRGPSNFGQEQPRDPAENCTPARILFVRNRILYARAALNTHGNVRYGFRHIRMLPAIPLIYYLLTI
jgi:hypothetical protein